MTWPARLRLTFGLLAVVALAGWLTFNLNDDKGRVTSTSASILTDSYTVGSAYAGLVVEQPVAVGESVQAGDALFVIDSAALRHDVAIGLVDPATSAVAIGADGTLTLTASADGIVADLGAAKGSFVQAGTQLAVVEKDDTLFIQAEYVLSPEQYARVEADAPVTISLPDTSQLHGSVQRVSVQTVSGKAQAVVTVASEALVRGDAEGLVAPGTPVTVDLPLRNDGVVTNVAQSVERVVRGWLE
ncbi:MAG: biotin attachment protein [Actinotalea sp.]|nr:biotin attachment protein [Actinotalea sp.]